MSPMNISNKICEMGEINYETCTNEYNHASESVIIANDILSEILESAMDIAICANNTTETKKMNIIDEIQDEYMDNCAEIKDIIEGLSKINVSNLQNTSPDPITLDVEMKRLLTEMMAPPFEIVNYESLPRKDGVGDQPQDTNQPAEREIDATEEEEEIKPSKPIEKKSRVTDLVMNSKKVLNNLLDAEERKRLEEWEESNEHVIQVIELQSKKIHGKPKRDIPPEIVPLPYDEDESDLLPKPNEETMESVELCQQENKKGGEGDDISKQISGDCCTIAEANPITTKSKSASFTEKKKKWNFNFKFLTFKKKSKAHAVDKDRAN